MTTYKQLISEISIEKMYDNMDYLVNQVGERLSGTPQMQKATKYICSKLQEYNVEAHNDHFPMYQSYPGEAQLKIIEPISMEIATRPVCHIESTSPEGIEGELIYLGSGGYADYDGLDVKGKIILTDMTWNPGRPEKARIAWELGAKALVIMNWGKSDSNLIQMGAVKTQWGNPTPETVKEIVKLPVISISRADGEKLVDLCNKQVVKIWMKANATRQWITADQPIGRVYGGKSNGQYVLVGSHVDAWGKSAICNASGNALNLELARICQKNRALLERDIVFVFWDGHEIAEGGGSTWYCDNYWSDMTNNCIAYINIDNLAIKGTELPGVEGLPEMKEFLMDAIMQVWNKKGVWNHAYKGGGDSSFFGIGVPYVSFATEYTEEKLKELNYAFYSPWLHSDSDTIDKIDRTLLKGHADYFMYIIEKIVNSKTVIYDMKALASDIKFQWEDIYNQAGIAKTIIKDIQPVVDEYVRSLEKLANMRLKATEDSSLANLYNRLAIYCERQTAMFRCESGRYGQDGCCSMQTENPIPALQRALTKYNNVKRESHEFYLWETQILRVKNMVFDALNNSIQIVNLEIETLK